MGAASARDRAERCAWYQPYNRAEDHYDARGARGRSGRRARAHYPCSKQFDAAVSGGGDCIHLWQVEKRFMEWMLRDDASPGMSINELELARQFGVGTTGIREFLNRFQSFGLIEKRPNAGWLFKGFTINFALELFEIREMFELRSAVAFASLPKTSPYWREIKELREEHLNVLEDIDHLYHDFSDLDSRFHRLINSAAPNPFVDSFYDLITLIFHYHYQWNKRDERQRNEVAIEEHLSYIDALLSRNVAAVKGLARRI